VGTPTVALRHTGAGKSLAKAFGSDEVGSIRGTFTFSTSYATGGEALDLSKYFRRLDMVKFENFATTATVNEVAYDYTNKKVLAYVSGTQVAAEVDLHTLALRFEATGLV
jgi:hypothetical protein